MVANECKLRGEFTSVSTYLFNETAFAGCIYISLKLFDEPTQLAESLNQYALTSVDWCLLQR